MRVTPIPAGSRRLRLRRCEDSASAIERVVVIGPAHYVPVRGIAIPTADAFQTPLGRVPVDQAPSPQSPICLS